jgi:hypothetical protein
MSAVVGSQYGATAGAAESLRAQLQSEGKLTTPRRENWKIRHENEILKANEHALVCTNLKSIVWYQKTYHKISWDYPFKPKLRKISVNYCSTAYCSRVPDPVGQHCLEPRVYPGWGNRIDQLDSWSQPTQSNQWVHWIYNTSVVA